MNSVKFQLKLVSPSKKYWSAIDSEVPTKLCSLSFFSWAACLSFYFFSSASSLNLSYSFLFSSSIYFKFSMFWTTSSTYCCTNSFWFLTILALASWFPFFLISSVSYSLISNDYYSISKLRLTLSNGASSSSFSWTRD